MAARKTGSTRARAGATKTTAKRAPARRKTPRKAAAGSAGLSPADCVPADTRVGTLGTEATEPTGDVQRRIVEGGGAVVGAYLDPLGGHPLVLAVLPIDRVAPTPFQRDLSEAHHKRLAEVIHKTGRFLDPIVVITAPDAGFWTPNGLHRLEAMRRLGAKAITALVVPDRLVAWQILALNTEKAHNLKERALEVIRIYRGLLEEDPTRGESGFAFYLEDPALVTIGVCYERQPRFAGGAYHPVLRRVLAFEDAPIGEAIRTHEAHADQVLAIEARVADVVARLRERGLTSPYLRSFVVARINPLRWIQGEVPAAAAVLSTMLDRATRFNVDKVRQEDLARAGGTPDEG